MALADKRRITASSALVFVTLLAGSGSTFGSAPDSGSFDHAAFAKGIEDHFRVEYGAEYGEPVAFDPAALAKGIEDHFRVEYGAEYGEPVAFDPAAFAKEIEDHFRVEYGE